VKSQERADVEHRIILGKRIPCICPRSSRTAVTGASYGRGYPVETVECELCGRTWRRLDPTNRR
jgi:hypothetical protein